MWLARGFFQATTGLARSDAATGFIAPAAQQTDFSHNAAVKQIRRRLCFRFSVCRPTGRGTVLDRRIEIGPEERSHHVVHSRGRVLVCGLLQHLCRRGIKMAIVDFVDRYHVHVRRVLFRRRCH